MTESKDKEKRSREKLQTIKKEKINTYRALIVKWVERLRITQVGFEDKMTKRQRQKEKTNKIKPQTTENKSTPTTINTEQK